MRPSNVASVMTDRARWAHCLRLRTPRGPPSTDVAHGLPSTLACNHRRRDRELVLVFGVLERQLRSQCQLQFGQLGNERRLDIQRWLHVDWQLWLQQRLGGRIELERKLGQLGVERSG